MTDQTIEQEIVAKGLIAPRITPADIEANIVGEFYFTADDGAAGALMTTSAANYPHVGGSVAQFPCLELLTFCVIVLKNGFTVTGESACASPENFDAVLGRKIARANAVSKCWPLLGYQLKERLYQLAHSPSAPE